MIDKTILNLLYPKGFEDMFWKLTKKHKTYIAAYDELESIFMENYGKRKYSDYDSFRVCRDRRKK